MRGIYQEKDNIGSVTDVDSVGKRITGYLAHFGSKDSYGDIIKPGAFKKTLEERRGKIWFLNQHIWSQPHGKMAELEEDAVGLRFVSNKMLDTSYSRDAMILYQEGVLENHSIGYQTIEADYNRETDIRYLKELKLYEGSNVTVGANTNTPFTGFKSITPENLEDFSSKVLKVLRHSNLTDETCERLEIALKQLQGQAFIIHQQRTAPEGPPAEGTQKDTGPQAAEQIRNFLTTLR